MAKPASDGSGDDDQPAADRPKRPQQVYTLVVEVGRKAGDGLPDKATGAGLVIYASGVDEADLAPLDVAGHGTLEERLKAGDEVGDDERTLMQRALDENSVIVAEMTPFFD